MTKVTYDIVEHDGGWAYRVDGVFSETFPSHDLARRAAERVRGAQARRPALRHRLLGERAGTASHAPYRGRDCAPVPVEAVARRHACPLLLGQCDAGATSYLVQGGPGEAVRPI